MLGDNEIEIKNEDSCESKLSPSTSKEFAMTKSTTHHSSQTEKPWIPPGILLHKNKRSRVYRNKIYSLPKKANLNEENFDETDYCTQSQNIEVNLFKKYLNKDLFKILSLQTVLKNAVPEIRRDKVVQLAALRLYYSNPTAYKLLRGTLNLPFVSTLKHLTCSSVPLDLNIFETLKTKFSFMTNEQKECVMSFEIFEIRPFLYYNISQDQVQGFHNISYKKSKSIAKYAIVCTLHGIFHNWTHPLNFGFLSQPSYKSSNYIPDWLNKTIRMSLQNGINIRALILNPDSSICINLRSNCEPYFKLDDKKIYYVFDLKQAALNLVMLEDCYFDWGVVRSTYIKVCYEIDKMQYCKLLTNWSDEMINMTNIDKKHAKLVFNETTVAALHRYVELQLLNQEAVFTATLITYLIKLFRLLCSRNFKGSASQLLFLKEVLHAFNNFKVPYNRKEESKCFNDYLRLTISSYILLYQDLIQDYPDFATMTLYRSNSKLKVSLMPPNNFNTTPTSKQFLERFQKYFSTCAMKPLIKGRCANLDNFFSAADDFVSIVSKSDIKDKSVPKDPNKVARHDYLHYRHLSLRCESIMSFVRLAKFLLAKCNEKSHVCVLKQNYSTKVSCDKLIYNPYYMNILTHFITNLDIKFLKFSRANLMCYNFLKNCTNFLEAESFPLPCIVFPKTYFIKLFIRLRLYQLLKLNAKLLKTKNFKRHNLYFNFGTSKSK